MKQSKLMSWIDTLGGTFVGFIVALILQYAVCWWYALPLRLFDNLGIVGIFTIASLIRGYGWRRFMEEVGVKVKMSAFALAVLAELQRQRTHEGYTEEHDAQHTPREIAHAGAAYLIGQNDPLDLGEGIIISGGNIWPWSDGYKPDVLRRDLVRGTALGMAAVELADRLSKRKRKTVPGAASEPASSLPVTAKG